MAGHQVVVLEARDRIGGRTHTMDVDGTPIDMGATWLVGTKNNPLADLMDACRNYPGLSNARRITFEYVMLKGVNDSLADAKAMVDLLAGIPAKINLIPFNPWPGTVYECSSNNAIRRFADYLSDAGLSAPIRHPRGQDILAACGQLKSESERMRASERRKLAAVEG